MPTKKLMTRHGFDFVPKPISIGSRVFNGLPVPVTACDKMVVQTSEQVYSIAHQNT